MSLNGGGGLQINPYSQREPTI